ncbi:unnamed protein product, partial [Phaeothamnion confervicola]
MESARPTARTARTEASHGEHGWHRKKALEPSFYRKDHFSSPFQPGLDGNIKRQTRLSLRLLEARNLLVSDLVTGTSDPVCFAWVGPKGETADPIDTGGRVQRTAICRGTADPIWDEELVFPLVVDTVDDVMEGQINVVIRDQDDEDGDVHYHELGRVTIPLKAVLLDGKV